MASTCPYILSSSNPTEVLVQNQEYHSCTIPSPLGQQRPYNSNGFHSLAKKNTYITSSFTLSMAVGFPRQEYWSGLPFPSLGDLLDPGNEPGSLALEADSLPTEPPGKHRAEIPKPPLLITMNWNAQTWCSSELPGSFKMLIPLFPQKLWPPLCRLGFLKSSPHDYSGGPTWEQSQRKAFDDLIIIYEHREVFTWVRNLGKSKCIKLGSL